jgi:hypothetical protein
MRGPHVASPLRRNAADSLSVMAAERGPGPVATVHRILIATALVGTLWYAFFELRAAVGGAGAVAFLRGAGALAVSAGIGMYLRSLRGLGAKLTPRDGEPREPPPRA